MSKKAQKEISNNKNLPNIGGQAVMEGVMMRNQEATAIVVRKAPKVYSIKRYNTNNNNGKTKKVKPWYKKWPFFRGVINFVAMMKLGVVSLNDSVKMLDLDEEEEPSKFEVWLANVTGKNVMDIAVSIAVFLGIGFSVLLFIVTPNLITTWISKSINNSFLINLLEGFIRLLIFVVYIVAISQMKDIKRFFSYHGAEHKTINAFENGEVLTVKNVQKHTTKHPRCGTSFLVFVMIISVIVFSLTGWEDQLWWQRIIMRILLLPVVASIAYETLMGLAKKDNFLVKILRWPGMQVQLITTKEPDDEMAAAAIISALAVMDDELFDTYCPEEFLHVSPRYQKEDLNANEQDNSEDKEEAVEKPKKEYTIIDFDEYEKQQKAQKKAEESAQKADDEQSESVVDEQDDSSQSAE